MPATPDKATPDVVEILTADHREMLELVEQIEGSNEPQRRRELADTVTAEVMRHAVTEEMFVYPAIADQVPDGSAEVEHDKKEHAEIVDTLKAMEDGSTDSPEFVQLVTKLGRQLHHHADDEESKQFPQLRRHLSTDQLIDMGSKVSAAKKVAPTRPHPHAPHSELFHKTVGPGVGFVDRLRDALTGRHTG